MNFKRKHLIIAAVVILAIASAILMTHDPFSLVISHPVGSECTVDPGQQIRFTGSYTNTWDESWSQRFRISQGGSIIWTSSTATVRGNYGTRSFDTTVPTPNTPGSYYYEITAEFWTGTKWMVDDRRGVTITVPAPAPTPTPTAPPPCAELPMPCDAETNYLCEICCDNTIWSCTWSEADSSWRIQWTPLLNCESHESCMCDDIVSCGSDITCECRSTPSPIPTASPIQDNDSNDDSLLYASAGGAMLILIAYLIYRKRGE